MLYNYVSHSQNGWTHAIYIAMVPQHTLWHYQARTQGFEKGGYIVKKFPLIFWHFNVKLFFSHDSAQE